MRRAARAVPSGEASSTTRTAAPGTARRIRGTRRARLVRSLYVGTTINGFTVDKDIGAPGFEPGTSRTPSVRATPALRPDLINLHLSGRKTSSAYAPTMVFIQLIR